MKSPGNDTIAAVATGAGGGIGIVRISGPEALAITTRIFHGRGGRSLADAAPFLLVLGIVADPLTCEPIDEVLAVHMPEGRSYTGEPTVEIQTHGGRVVLESVLQAALKGGARHAGPGEFTKRAFLSGRLDLTQAEAVARLIGAENEAERHDALLQLRGAMAGKVNLLRERLLDLTARVEAALDFEEDEFALAIPTWTQVAALSRDIRDLADRASVSSGAAGGLRVAIAGRTNSGKSSIFNYLLDFERSIVTPIAGTTRDYIEERSVIGGAAVTLIDTAGLRATADVVEAEGVRRSLQRIEKADVVVLILNGSERNHPEDLRLFDLVADRSPIVVISKADLPLCFDLEQFRSGTLRGNLAFFSVSVVSGQGFPALTETLTSRCRKAYRDAVPHEAVPNIRHRDALERAAGYLDAAAELGCSGAGPLDQSALELRAALNALGEITGETATEEVLERIFSRFCVGK